MTGTASKQSHSVGENKNGEIYHGGNYCVSAVPGHHPPDESSWSDCSHLCVLGSVHSGGQQSTSGTFSVPPHLIV